MWTSEAFESEMKPFPCFEFVQLLEGELTITEQDGVAHHFAPGDAFFVPMGTVCSWKTERCRERSSYCMLDPAAA